MCNSFKIITYQFSIRKQPENQGTCPIINHQRFLPDAEHVLEISEPHHRLISIYYAGKYELGERKSLHVCDDRAPARTGGPHQIAPVARPIQMWQRSCGAHMPSAGEWAGGQVRDRHGNLPRGANRAAPRQLPCSRHAGQLLWPHGKSPGPVRKPSRLTHGPGPAHAPRSPSFSFLILYVCFFGSKKIKEYERGNSKMIFYTLLSSCFQSSCSLMVSRFLTKGLASTQ